MLPERLAVGLACSAGGAGVGVPGVLLADGALRALAWFALFTAVTAIVTTSTELVPMQDGADEAVPAPRAPERKGAARRHLFGGVRGTALVLAMAAFAAGHGFGGNFPARFGGVLLGAGLCTLGAALWLARWERRTGQILLTGPARPAPQRSPGPTAPASAPARTDVASVQRKLMAGEALAPDDQATLARIPDNERKARETAQEAYYVLARDPADWPAEWPGDASPAEPVRAEPDPSPGRRWRPSAGTKVWLVVGALFVAGFAIAFSLEPLEESGTLELSRCPGVAPLPAPVAGAPVRLGAGVTLLTAADGILWATSSVQEPWPSTDGSAELLGLDTHSGRVLLRAPLDVDPTELVASGGWLWGTYWEEGAVIRIDPRTGRQSGPPLSLGGKPSALAAGEGAVWVLVDEGRSIRRIDTETGRVGPALATGGEGWTLAAGAGALWMADDTLRGVRRIDARTGAVATIPLDLYRPGTPVVGPDSVWVPGESFLARVDLRSLTARGPRIPIGFHGAGPVIAGGALWFANPERGLFRVDPRCGRASGPFVATLGVAGDEIVPAGGTLWVGDWLRPVLVPVRTGA